MEQRRYLLKSSTPFRYFAPCSLLPIQLFIFRFMRIHFITWILFLLLFCYFSGLRREKDNRGYDSFSKCKMYDVNWTTIQSWDYESGHDLKQLHNNLDVIGKYSHTNFTEEINHTQCSIEPGSCFSDRMGEKQRQKFIRRIGAWALTSYKALARNRRGSRCIL